MSNKSKAKGVDPAQGAKLFHVSRPLGLARALMKAGYGTRKQAEEMVQVGRVAIDGKTIFDPRRRVGPENEIWLDNAPLIHLQREYFAFHKPLRVVCTPSDGLGRKLVEAYLPKDVPGLTAAGRLDGRTTGLLLISNDRVWNNLITRNHDLEQEYRVQIDGYLSDPEIAVLTAGIHLPKGGVFKPASVKIIEQLSHHCVLSLVIQEGKVRQVRRVFSTLRRKVTMMRRIRMGEIRLGDLSPGELRRLEGPEVERMRTLCQAAQPGPS